MKLIFDPGEKEQLNKIYEEYPDMNIFCKDDPDRRYAIKFKVSNPAIASYILCGMLHNRLKDDIDIGIEIEEISMNPIQSTDAIKNKLHEMIDEIVH